MKRVILIVVLLSFLFPAPVSAQEDNPWSDVFLPDGSMNPDIVDLGVTIEHPAWMSMDLPFGQSLELDASYHKYQTPEGHTLVMPSTTTLFFMAMNPQESGLMDAYGFMGNGFAALTSFLGLAVGDNLNWSRVQADHPEYSHPDQFWGDVLGGDQDVWTYFSGWSFLTKMFQISKNDAALRSSILLYLKDSGQDPAPVASGNAGVSISPPQKSPECPAPTVSVQEPLVSIQKTGPANPLVIGQDTANKRGADIEARVTVPPVIFIWHEPIYEDRFTCLPAAPGVGGNCSTGSGTGNNGIARVEAVLVECRTHIEHLPDAVTSLRATAMLDAASQDWIKNKLGQTHYGAFLHQPSLSLIPGTGSWSGGCDGGGTCSATGTALRVPFADPGTFNLRVDITTAGASFRGIPVTPPRTKSANGSLQVYVTLPALIP